MSEGPLDRHSVSRVDGYWGPKTAMALENFQKSKNIQPTAELDQKTISALKLSLPQPGENSQAAGEGGQGSNNASH
jgi:peptidoglycan hydrolase-like protein with peptidoglycan-binding domain